MNKEKFEFLGILRFHDRGYFGKGITIADREGTRTKHGRMVFDIISMVAPDSKILLNYKLKKNIQADIYTTSLFFNSDNFEKTKDISREAYSRNVFLCCAVGNSGTESQSPLSKHPEWASIGACDLSGKTLKRMSYSSITNDIDYMSFTNINTSEGKFTGTSCAAPLFASMCALVQQFFKEKCGRKLTNNELTNFINDNTIDMGEEFFDPETGNGVFRLPDPDSIDINKYIGSEKIIKLKIGDTIATVNNKKEHLDVAPIIQNNRTLVPLRFIVENLDYEVIWKDDTREIYIIKE